MIINLRRSLVMSLIALAIFGFAYAFAGTGISQVLFHFQANGSITAGGSTLIGQNWSKTVCPGHLPGSCVFQGRPDDLGPYATNLKANVAGGDNPLVANGVNGGSGATNLGPRSQLLVTDTKALVTYWRRRGVTPTTDLVTTSGSGYDPDITPSDALAEVPMVARATGITPMRLERLITSQTHPAQFGFLGSSFINVLSLNEALARLG